MIEGVQKITQLRSKVLDPFLVVISVFLFVQRNLLPNSINNFLSFSPLDNVLRQFVMAPRKSSVYSVKQPSIPTENNTDVAKHKKKALLLLLLLLIPLQILRFRDIPLLFMIWEAYHYNFAYLYNIPLLTPLTCVSQFRPNWLPHLLPPTSLSHILYELFTAGHGRVCEYLCAVRTSLLISPQVSRSRCPARQPCHCPLWPCMRTGPAPPAPGPPQWHIRGTAGLRMDGALQLVPAARRTLIRWSQRS